MISVSLDHPPKWSTHELYLVDILTVPNVWRSIISIKRLNAKLAGGCILAFFNEERPLNWSSSKAIFIGGPIA